MFTNFWHFFLYQPLFNVLVWIYSNVARQNLGWAVIWLTIFLRVILLPLTIKSECDAKLRENTEAEALKLSKDFKGDVVAQKEAIRSAMKKNRISPWAKILILGIQLLVLILLYQVFIGGIEGRRAVVNLYGWIDFPGKLNTDFYGFNIGARHDYIWSGIAAIYLFASILLANRGEKWNTKKASFLFLFPLATFFALWILPMVKSLFILTSMIFSDIIALMMTLFSPKKKES